MSILTDSIDRRFINGLSNGERVILSRETMSVIRKLRDPQKARLRVTFFDPKNKEGVKFKKIQVFNRIMWCTW